MTNFRYLAFLDILGFKDLIEANSLDYLTTLYKKFEPALLYSFSMTNTAFRLENIESSKLPKLPDMHLNSLIISDSVIIWSDNDNANSFVDIIAAVRHFLNLSFVLGLPLRGAITVGSLSIIAGKHTHSAKFNSYNTILGDSLTKSYTMQGKLNIAGCIVDDDCIEHFKNDTSLEPGDGSPLTISILEKMNFLKKYRVPMKGGKIEDKFLINWTHYYGHRLTPTEVRNAFSAHNKKCDVWEVEEKIQNTLNFLTATDKDYNDFKEYMNIK